MQNTIYPSRSRTTLRLLIFALIGALLLPAPAWAGLQPPLKKVAVPKPSNLADFVKNEQAAIRLGKALFWDMQAGSDGMVACATCHYKAGADPTGPSLSGGVRSKNQVHPGPDNVFGANSLSAPLGPNYLLSGGEFPLFQVAPADGRVGIDTIVDPIFGTAPTATITRNINDVVGSQGVPRADFVSLVSGTAIENGTPQSHPIFGNHRQVTDRNSPSVINAVFNFANFWDGRANNIFNGVNPFGPLDQGAEIWVNNGGTVAAQKISIPNASLASQATGPPMSDVEMAFRGRTFPMLGRKMINNGLIPLGTQLVHPDDSVLGALSRQNATLGVRGLDATYEQMIQDAFQDKFWNGGNVSLPEGSFSQMEANFSLFWGLAIMLYESTLVADNTNFDRFQLGNKNALSLPAQLGFATFDSKCAVCHSGPEFSDAVVGSNAVANCIAPNCNLVSFTSNTNHKLILQNQTITLGAKSDAGFFNIAVRPTADDAGRGGTAPFLNLSTSPTASFPLSFSRLAELGTLGQLPFDAPALPPFATTTDAVQGSFKTPGLRNIELNPPYFHNGSAMTLIEVVEFYTRGGNFPFNIGNQDGNRELASAVQPLGKLRGGGGERFEVVEFLKSLTDERVRLEKAPFDHPELIIPNGDGAPITLPATGGPITPVPVNTLTLNPFTSPTTSTVPIIGGFVDQTATVEVRVVGRQPAAATVLGNAWSFTFTGFPLGESLFDVVATSPTGETRAHTATERITLLPTALIFGGPLGAVKQTSAALTVGGTDAGGRKVDFYRFKLDNGEYGSEFAVDAPLVVSNLSDGMHTVSVIARDVLGNQQPLETPTTVSWRVKAGPPAVTVDPVTAPAGTSSLTITGTISELGTIPRVSADTGAACIATVTDVPGSDTETWSCRISGLKKGTNNLTVTATDIAQNVGSATTSVTVILPDGSFKGTTGPDIGDAVKALRIAVELVNPSVEDMLHGDVAPLLNGVPAPDGKIDVNDALVILKKVVGLIDF